MAHFRPSGQSKKLGLCSILFLQPHQKHFIRRVDVLGHGLRLLVFRHVLAGVVGDHGVAVWVPGQEQLLFLLVQRLSREGLRQLEQLQRFFDVFAFQGRGRLWPFMNGGSP